MLTQVSLELAVSQVFISSIAHFFPTKLCCFYLDNYHLLYFYGTKEWSHSHLFSQHGVCLSKNSHHHQKNKPQNHLFLFLFEPVLSECDGTSRKGRVPSIVFFQHSSLDSEETATAHLHAHDNASSTKSRITGALTCILGVWFYHQHTLMQLWIDWWEYDNEKHAASCCAAL